MKIITRAIQALDKLVWRVTGRQHVYHVEIWYKGGDEAHVFNSPRITGTVGLTYRGTQAETLRAFRRWFGPQLLKAMPKGDRANGRLIIERISYLGRF